LAARFVRDEEAAGSNPATPTTKPQVIPHEAACDLRLPLSRCPILGAKPESASSSGISPAAVELAVPLDDRAVAGGMALGRLVVAGSVPHPAAVDLAGPVTGLPRRRSECSRAAMRR
jgi:hypothetical protein